MDVHAAAQPLQHLCLGEVCQTAVVHVQLVDEPLQLLRPARTRRHVLRDQANQLLGVSLGTNRTIPGRHAQTGADAAAFPGMCRETKLITMRIISVALSE